MKNKIIELKSTPKGLIGHYVMNFVLLLILSVALIITFPIFDGAFEKTVIVKGSCETVGDGSFYERTTCDYRNPETISEYLSADAETSNESTAFFSFITMLGLMGFILANICGIIGNIYRAKMVNVIDKENGKIVENSFYFPYQTHEDYRKFERIVSVSVRQGIFDNIFNTGRLELKLVTFANADVLESLWWICYIENPLRVKEQILEGLPDHEGLEVNLKTNDLENKE